MNIKNKQNVNTFNSINRRSLLELFFYLCIFHVFENEKKIEKKKFVYNLFKIDNK